MSQYAQDMKQILAALQEGGAGDTQPQPLPDEEPVNTVYIYPTDKGGLLFTSTPIEEDQEPQTIIESGEPAPQPATHPTTRREPPYFLHFILILFLFIVLDSADAALTALLTPTATITITPGIQTITLRSTATLGKLLSPITLTESQTVLTTGHRHQNARQATGTLTFYNGLSTVQSIAAGTVFAGQDGVQVATNAPVTIAANNPPNDGEAQVSAHAVQPGSNGNIPALDINGTFSTALYVKNLTPFSNGQDERDYKVVTQADRDTAAATLKAKVTSSMTAALQGQLIQGEQLQTMPCTPTVTTDHGVGDEATTVQVTVSESCTAIAYNTKELDDQATKLLTTQAAKTVGTGYMLYGDVKVSVTQATTNTTTPGVLLSFTCQGTYVYILTAKAQQSIKTLIAGKPRNTALRLLVTLPGIMNASINGIPDNQQIPDADHIHLLIVLIVF